MGTQREFVSYCFVRIVWILIMIKSSFKRDIFQRWGEILKQWYAHCHVCCWEHQIWWSACFFREKPSSHACCQPISWPREWGFCLTCSTPCLSPSTWTQSSLMRRRPCPHQWKTSKCWLTVSSSCSQSDQLLISVPLALWVLPLVFQAWGFPRAVSFLFLLLLLLFLIGG